MNTLPATVLAAYGQGKSTPCHSLGDGMVNTTYKLNPPHNKPFVLQRLSPVFDDRVIGDYVVVSDWLATAGWPVPQLLEAKIGSFCVRDDNAQLWRAFDYLENDQPTLDAPYMQQVGALLAKLHDSLAAVFYQPSFHLPHFHDTLFYASQLEEMVETSRFDSAGSTVATQVLDHYYRLPPLPDTSQQLIHGDPRLGNILCQNGKPFTFIDFDTLMLGTVWLDIGDVLRSIVETNAAQPDCVAFLSAAIQGYYDTAKPPTSYERFQQNCRNAGMRIALELSMRFLIDCVDDSYFTWDATTFKSRTEHNLARANQQRSIYAYLQRRIV